VSRNPLASSPPFVALAGVDTLYVNAYYADLETFGNVEMENILLAKYRNLSI
jgi:hypothetical protein